MSYTYGMDYRSSNSLNSMHKPVYAQENMARTIVPFTNSNSTTVSASSSIHDLEYYKILREENVVSTSTVLVHESWSSSDVMSVMLELCPCLDALLAEPRMNTKNKRFSSSKIVRNEIELFKQMLLN